MKYIINTWKFIKYHIHLFKKNKLYYGHGFNTAYTEIIYLIKHILNYKYQKSLQKTIKFNNKKQFNKLKYLLKLRIHKKIPIVYLTKEIWYCNKKFYINNQVIIPKSPIGKIMKINIKNKISPKKILDLGTGNACLAIICSYIYPTSKIDATDISNKALILAKKNILLHKKEKQIKLIKSNLFNNLNKNKYDLIISNPPYVNPKDLKYLPKEYLYEPKLGLLSNLNGTEIITKILLNAHKYLTRNGWLLCEVGYQKEKIEEKFLFLKPFWIHINKKIQNIFFISKKHLFLKK